MPHVTPRQYSQYSSDPPTRSTVERIEIFGWYGREVHCYYNDILIAAVLENYTVRDNAKKGFVKNQNRRSRRAARSLSKRYYVVTPDLPDILGPFYSDEAETVIERMILDNA